MNLIAANLKDSSSEKVIVKNFKTYNPPGIGHLVWVVNEQSYFKIENILYLHDDTPDGEYVDISVWFDCYGYLIPKDKIQG